MWKIQIAISWDLCIRLTWNFTGSCSQQQRLRGWSRMVVKQFQDGGRPPFWKSLYRHISAKKSSDFHEILYTAADFELDERHVIKNEQVALDRLRVRQNVFLVHTAKHNITVSSRKRQEPTRTYYVFTCSHMKYDRCISLSTLYRPKLYLWDTLKPFST